MPTDVASDSFVVIRIDGLHCHRCEEKIDRAVSALRGVREVEVDFATGQASVLYDPRQVKVRQLTDAVTSAGYRVESFAQGGQQGATP